MAVASDLMPAWPPHPALGRDDDSDLWDDSDYHYIPYSQTMPRTDDLNVLRRELKHQRATRGIHSSQAQEAFENLFRTSVRLGRPLDGLTQFSPVEAERFFALILEGSDGHVYWLGAQRFLGNNHRATKPNRWWWAHLNNNGAPLSPYFDVFPECGDAKCIAPDHQATGRDTRRRIYTDEQMIGALQVAAMRNNGRPPRSADWRGSPSRRIYIQRFGSWIDALVAAGIIKSADEYQRYKADNFDPTVVRRPRTYSEARRTLRTAQKFLGHIPTEREFLRNEELRAFLRDHHLITSPTTIKKHLGGWPEAVKAAFDK